MPRSSSFPATPCMPLTCHVRVCTQRASLDTSCSCLVLSYTHHWLGERSPLGRAAALLAGYPPPTTSTMDLQCGADRHPSPRTSCSQGISERRYVLEPARFGVLNAQPTWRGVA
jgi:hypothetical protein